MPSTFLVTGATGALGHLIVRALVDRVGADRVAASTRTPDDAGDLAALGVDVRRADFAEPDSLPAAFEGVDRLLLISSNARAQGGDPLAQHRAVIDAARGAGVGRVVYTSQMAASPTSAFAPMHDHAATEDMLRASGVPWAALRNGFYGSSGRDMMRDAFETGSKETPADGPFSWVAHGDLAEAAAVVLAEDRYDGPTPPLTGPEALDFGDLARIASELTGRPVRREVVSDEVMRATLEAQGLPPHVVEIYMGMYIGARDGEWAAVDPELETLIGRPRTTMREMMEEREA